MIAKVKNATGDTFLPREVSQVFLSMMSLMDDFQALSYERAVKRTKPHVNYKPCEAECYPNNPEHTIENHYWADTRRDKTEDKKCGKSYNSKATITGGLTHLSCHHGVVKGFTALQRGESPLLIVGPALRRLPARVKAKRRFFIYDNACAAHKSCLRRFPHRVRNWTFLVDRTHWKNHTACHMGYNMDLYPQLKGVNSQQAEQINRSLRSLAVVLAFSSFDHYMKILELYFVYKNVKTRQSFNKQWCKNFNFFWHNKLAKIRRCVSITFIEISPIEVEKCVILD